VQETVKSGRVGTVISNLTGKLGWRSKLYAGVFKSGCVGDNSFAKLATVIQSGSDSDPMVLSPELPKKVNILTRKMVKLVENRSKLETAIR